MQTNDSFFEEYLQILFWPLEMLRESTEAPTGWESAALEPLHRGVSTDPWMYEEFVYFHPYARQFLYPKKDDARAFTLHQRTDVGRVRVEFHDGPAEVLDVDRVHLYQFQRQQVAILVVEVSAKRPISRDAVLLIEDRFRRIYPPYWERMATDLTPEWDGGHCPKSVEWLDRHGASIAGAAKSDYDQPKLLTQEVEDRRPPVCAHWKWLLTPFEDFRLLEDDRASSMVFLLHENPALLSRADLVRHCFYDGPGPPTELPYSEAFLRDFEEKHTYNRFWNPDPSPHNWMKTIYTCCGYGFTVITQTGLWGKSLREHFRHHYFQLGLLAHFHRATLLRFSNRFSQTGKNAEDHYRQLRDVRREFAKFISTSWFHEISNQEQGRELFELWSRHLRSEELMKNILTEAKAVDNVLRADEQDKVSERQDKLARRLEVLTVLLYLAAAATVVIAALDSEVVRGLIKHSPGKEETPPWFWKWTLFWASVLGLILTVVFRRVMYPEEDTRQRYTSALTWVLLAGMLLAAALCLLDLPVIRQLLR